MLIVEKEVVLCGKYPRIARLAFEYDWIEDPRVFVEQVRRSGKAVDVFSFLGKVDEGSNVYEFPQAVESISVIPLSTYDVWWKRQINDKTRNMIRKSHKAGVEVRLMEFTDELVHGIKQIYDESPLRQGKPFAHYGKDFDTLKKDHASFLEKSEFVGAFYDNKLIGFIKLVHGVGLSHLMQIISQKSYQSKAPSNALIAKAVEICAKRQVAYLHYGIWSMRGLGDFKRHHGFECLNLRRYYIPLNWRGRLFLTLNLHHDFADRMPEWLVDFMVNLRTRLYMRKYGMGKA